MGVSGIGLSSSGARCSRRAVRLDQAGRGGGGGGRAGCGSAARLSGGRRSVASLFIQPLRTRFQRSGPPPLIELNIL
jgi:hypothetical protein